MKLEELLKEKPEALKAINDALEKVNAGQEDKLKHVRFADLSEGGYVSKDKYSSLETDLAGKTTELTKANELIEELKKSAGKDEATQQKIATYETEIADLKKENAELKTENALKFALVAAGAVDVDYLVFKAKEKGEIKLTEDGKIKGEDDLITLQIKCSGPIKVLKHNIRLCFRYPTAISRITERFLKIIFQTVTTIRQSQKNSS